MYLVPIMSSRLADGHKSSQTAIDIAGEILGTFRVGPCEATERALHYGMGSCFLYYGGHEGYSRQCSSVLQPLDLHTIAG